MRFALLALCLACSSEDTPIEDSQPAGYPTLSDSDAARFRGVMLSGEDAIQIDFKATTGFLPSESGSLVITAIGDRGRLFMLDRVVDLEVQTVVDGLLIAVEESGVVFTNVSCFQPELYFTVDGTSVEEAWGELEVRTCAVSDPTDQRVFSLRWQALQAPDTL